MTRVLLILFGLFVLIAVGFIVADIALSADCAEAGGAWERKTLTCYHSGQ